MFSLESVDTDPYVSFDLYDRSHHQLNVEDRGKIKEEEESHGTE